MPILRRLAEQKESRIEEGHLIFYRVREAAIDIVHLLHGARDFEAILFSGREVTERAQGRGGA